MSYTYVKPSEVARIIRDDLKNAFKGVKFSVKTSGDSVTVRYTDGPTVSQVSDVIHVYEEGHFDGMQDMYISANRPGPTVKYIFVERDYSPEIKKKTESYITDRLCLPEGTTSLRETNFREYHDVWNLGCLRVLSKIDLSLPSKLILSWT